MAPTRRALLAALSVGLAGCGGGAPTESETASDTPTDQSSSTPSETPSSTPSETETPITGPRRVELDDERLHWRVDFPDRRVMEPAVADGRLYVAAGDDPIVTDTADESAAGRLTALALPDGRIDWDRLLDDPPTGHPQVHNGSIYFDIGRSTGFDGLDQRLIRVDGDGSQRWASATRDAFLDVLDIDGDSAYLGTSDDQLAPEGERTFAVDLATGEERWAVDGGDSFGGRVDGETLYADYASMALSARATEDGSERWQRPVRPLHAGDESFPTAAGSLFATVETDEGYGFAGINAADGSTTWTRRSDGDSRYVVSSVVTVGDAVIATEADDLLTGRDAATGDLRWKHSFEERVGAPVPVNNTLYAPIADGSVAAVDIESGDLLWHESVAADGYPQLYGSGETPLAVVQGREKRRSRPSTATTARLGGDKQCPPSPRTSNSPTERSQSPPTTGRCTA